MRAKLLALGAILVLAASVAPAQDKIPANCDRACLESLVDRYLQALVAHDPSILPLSQDVMYTENDQVLDAGDGFWGTVSEVGNYRHVFVDPVTQQAGFMGTMREGENLLLMTLRLRVQLGRITEIETTYYRQGGGGPSGIKELDAQGKPEALWFEPIPESERLSRHELIEVANGYFAGLEKNDGKGLDGKGYYPFTEDCHRIENGYATTNNPNPNTPPDGYDAWGKGCLEQFRSGYFNIVQKIHSRRYPLVDEQYGVVWGYAVFNHPGTVREVHLTNGKTVQMRGFNRPSSIEVTEAFRIEGGKIRRIEMIGSGTLYNLNSPWPGGLSGK